jgi:hypothetical protein
MDHLMPFVIVMALMLLRLFDRDQSRTFNEPSSPQPLLTANPRPCPFCGGQSVYHWQAGPGGGHRLKCRACHDVYTFNAGAATFWSITNAGGTSELCSAVSEEQAREFIEKVLVPIAPGVAFEVRLGADEKTPCCWAYFQTLKQLCEHDLIRPLVRH